VVVDLAVGKDRLPEAATRMLTKMAEEEVEVEAEAEDRVTDQTDPRMALVSTVDKKAIWPEIVLIQRRNQVSPILHLQKEIGSLELQLKRPATNATKLVILLRTAQRKGLMSVTSVISQVTLPRIAQKRSQGKTNLQGNQGSQDSQEEPEVVIEEEPEVVIEEEPEVVIEIVPEVVIEEEPEVVIEIVRKIMNPEVVIEIVRKIMKSLRLLMLLNTRRSFLVSRLMIS